MRRSLFSVLLLGVLSLNALAHLGLLADTAYAQEQAPTPTPASTLPFIGPGATFLPSPTPTDSQSTSAPAPTPTPVSTTSETKSVSSFCKEEANRLEGSFLKVIIEPMCNLTYSFLEGIASFFGDIIQQGSEYFSAIDLNPEENYEQFWELARSATNYFIVIGLIIAAFSNVTRWQIETFSIKKILPALIIGFLLANLSLFICRLVIDLSDSIAVTASDTLGRAVGAENTNGIGKFFEAWLKGIFGIGNEVGNFLSNPFGWTGTIGGLLKLSSIPMMVTLILPTMAIFALIPPLLAFIALWAIFIVRHYVVLFLVIVSPLAFISMAFPFSQRWFQAWWKQLINWVFMKPIAFTILMLGTVAISQPIYDSLVGGVVSFIAGMAAIYYAVTVPFKLGGTITSSLWKLTRSGGSEARVGIASFGQKNSGKTGLVGGAGRLASGLSSVLYSKDVYKEAREKKREKTEATAKIGAARFIGEGRLAERYEDALTAEARKEFDDKTMGQTLNDILGPKGKAFNAYQKRAALQSLYQKGYPPLVWDTADGMIREAEKRNDTAEAARLRKILGLAPGEYVGTDVQKRTLAIASIVGEKPKKVVGKDGKTEYELSPGLAVRTRQELSSAAAGKNMYAEAIALQQDYKTGTFRILSNDEAEAHITKFIGSDPQLQANKATTDTWLKEVTINGTSIKRLREGIVQAFASGLIDHSMTIDQNSRFDRNVAAELRKPEVWAAVTDQLKEAQKTMGQAERIETDIFMEVFGPNAKDPKSEDVRKLLKDLPGGKKEEAGTKSPTSHSEASADTSSFGTPSSST